VLPSTSIIVNPNTETITTTTTTTAYVGYETVTVITPTGIVQVTNVDTLQVEGYFGPTIDGAFVGLSSISSAIQIAVLGDEDGHIKLFLLDGSGGFPYIDWWDDIYPDTTPWSKPDGDVAYAVPGLSVPYGGPQYVQTIGGGYPCETVVFDYSIATGVLSPFWVNPDGSIVECQGFVGIADAQQNFFIGITPDFAITWAQNGIGAVNVTFTLVTGS